MELLILFAWHIQGVQNVQMFRSGFITPRLPPKENNNNNIWETLHIAGKLARNKKLFQVVRVVSHLPTPSRPHSLTPPL
ncbi:MAG: hypothetical protein IJQ34_04400, partial [Kiritimatiellae bacterium]|nr:hypothetical protein [Kiritimatiellia bacterium]